MGMASVYSSVVVCNWCNEDIPLKFVDNNGPNWCGKCPAPPIVVRARAEERARLLPIISRLLEAYNDGYELSGDEIDDAYRALEDE